MELKDTLALIHPAIAIGFVFPLIGMVINRSWLTRQRRLQAKSGEKSKIPPNVGSEHLAIVQDIYQDRKNRWRRRRIPLNCFATILFLGQGITGARDMLKIPLSWQ